MGINAISTTPGQAAILSNAPAACDVAQFGSNVIQNVTWFRFRPTVPGVYRVETCSLVNFDTRIAVTRACNDPASCIAGDDNNANCPEFGPCTLSPSTNNPSASRACFAVTEDDIAGDGLLIAIGTNSPGVNGTGAFRIVGESSDEDGTSCQTAFTVAGASGGGASHAFNSSASTSSPIVYGCSLAAPDDGTIHRAVWFRFVADATELVEFSTCGGTGFDTRLAVFTGCDAPPVACNDDDPSCPTNPFRSRITLAVAQGSEYLIAVGGHSASAAGVGALRIVTGAQPPPQCGGVARNCCEPSSPDSPGPFCSDAACCELMCGIDQYCCEVDWDDVCANRAAVVCAGCGAGQCGDAAVGSGGRPESEDCYEGLNEGCDTVPASTMPILVGETILGRFWAGIPNPQGGQDANDRDQDVYEFVLSEPATVTASLFSAGPGMVLLLDDQCPPEVIAISDEFAPACPAVASACLPAGRHRVLAQISVRWGFPCPEDGGMPNPANEYSLQLSATKCLDEAPPNDDCESAFTVQSGDAIPFSSVLATTSPPGLPFGCDEGNGVSFVRDVWYSWTPLESGIARVSTCPPDGPAGFDTRLAAYAGSCSGGIVGCNDDSPDCFDFGSVMTFEVSANITYLVRVGGFDSAGSGIVRFDLFPRLPNDDCAHPEPVALGVPEPLDTRLATDSAPRSLPTACNEGNGTAIAKDLWFTFTADCTGTATASTCGTADFDTWLVAYPGSCGAATAVIACNDDAAGCDGFTSRVSFDVVEGSHYRLRVGGALGDSGSGTLLVTCQGNSPPANDRCVDAAPLPLGKGGAPLPVEFDLSGATSNAPTVPSGGCAGSAFSHDVWFSYQPAFTEITEISLCGGLATFDTRLELWDACPADIAMPGGVVACNDDSPDCPGGQSAISMVLNGGTTYYIRVGSFSEGTRGPGTLSVTPKPCRPDLDGSGLIEGGDLGILVSAWGSPGGPEDLDESGLVDGGDLAVLLAAWGPCQ